MKRILKTAVATILCFGIIAGVAPSEAHALSKKDRQILTGVAIGVGVGALARKGRDIRHERATQRYAQNQGPVIVEQAIVNTQSVFAGMNRPERVGLQRQLRDAGYYAGSLDGAWGPRMQHAFLELYSHHPQAARVSADGRSVRGFMYDLAY